MQVSERDFEDWLVGNIEELMGKGAAVVGRQVHIPGAGIADVLAARDEMLWVIELKAETARMDALAQVLRYKGALEGGYNYLLGTRAERDAPEDMEGFIRGRIYKFGAAIAAPSFADDLYLPAAGAGVHLATLTVAFKCYPYWANSCGTGCTPEGYAAGRLAESWLPLVKPAPIEVVAP